MRSIRPTFWRLTALVVLAIATPPFALACPFCKPVGPTLAQQRERAATVVLGELRTVDDEQITLLVRQVLRGERIEAGASLVVPSQALEQTAVRVGQLAVLFGEELNPGNETDHDWRATPVNEFEYGYLARAPSLREPGAERLRYFAGYLEHADSLIAADAYLEFAHAPFDVVEQASDAVESPKLRAWLTSDNVPVERKGLYGLLLGLRARRAQQPEDLALLRQLVAEQVALTAAAAAGSDFRPGVDGLLGGYFVALGAPALEQIDQELLQNPDAAEGNLRHAVTALRFAYEYLDNLPDERVAQSMRLLLARPSFAATAIIDLARWQHDAALADVVALYDVRCEQQPAIRRAIVGYLINSQAPAAKQALAALRARDPDGIASAERYYQQFGGLGVAGLR